MPRPIAQFPNRPLLMAMAAGAVARRADGETARVAGLLSKAALLVWAYQEITDGANWLRRLFGVGGAAYALGALSAPARR
jgi:hypothetical protein